jgi:serine/threonine-protein kinase RsbW
VFLPCGWCGKPDRSTPEYDWAERPLSSMLRAVVMSNSRERILHEQVFRQATLDDLAAIRQFVRRVCAGCGLIGPALEELIVAVNEATSNIVRHGFQGRPADITVSVTCGQNAVQVTLLDQGPAFDPDSAPRPDTTLPLEQRPFGGMGVQLMRELCDGLQYRRDPGGRNELCLVKKISPES